MLLLKPLQPVGGRAILVTPPKLLQSCRRISSTASCLSTDSAVNVSKLQSSSKPLRTVDEVKRLFSLAKPQRRQLTAGILLLFVSASVSMAVPLAFGRTLDVVTQPAALSNLPVSLPTAAGGLVCFFALGGLANFGRVIYMRMAGQRIIADARKAAFTNVMHQDMAWFDAQLDKPTTIIDKANVSEPIQEAQSTHSEKQPSLVRADRTATDIHKEHSDAPNHSPPSFSASSSSHTQSATQVRSTGDIISRLASDASIVGEALTKELSEGLFAIFSSIAGIGLMFYISVKLTLLSLFLIPPIAIGAVFYGRYVKKITKRIQQSIAKIVSFSEEKLTNIKTVHAFNAIPNEIALFNSRVEEVFSLQRKETIASGFFFASMSLSGNLTGLSLLGYGGFLVSAGELTVGQLSAMSLYALYVGRGLSCLSIPRLIRVFTADLVSALTSFYSSIMRGLAASARIFELIDAKPRHIVIGKGRTLSPNEPNRILEFRSVQFEYPTRPGIPVLNDISLKIKPGESVALAGGSGSGKSTIARLLLRYYDVNRGSINYGNEDISYLTPESWRDRVAIVDQEPILWSASVRDNLTYGDPSITMEDLIEATRAANCLEFIERLPEGFETQVGRGGKLFSGGQKQRLAIARALIRKPQILILDEATSALDSTSETLINQSIARITQSQALTTILVAHRLSTLRSAHKILLVQDGKITEMGSFTELTKEGTQFAKLVSNQLMQSG